MRDDPEFDKLLEIYFSGESCIKQVKFVVVAPGLPEEFCEFVNVEPTSAITEGVLKQAAIELMLIGGDKVGISLSPRDFVNLCDCGKFAKLMVDKSLDNGEYARAIVVCPPSPLGIVFQGLSLVSKKRNQFTLL